MNSKIHSLLFSALFAIVLTVPFQSHGTKSCEAIFSNKTLKSQTSELKREPEIGKLYRIQFYGDPSIHIMKLNGLVESRGKILFEFSEVQDDKNTQLRYFSESQVIKAAWREIENDSTFINTLSKLGTPIRTIGKIIAPPIALIATARNVSNFMFRPFRLLAKNESAVEVLGHLTSSKISGQKIADQVQEFDKVMTNMGFIRPELTSIIIGGKLFLPNLNGPSSLSIPIFNLWSRKKSTAIIAMSPLLLNSKTIYDESVLYHERTHSLLNSTYNNTAYVIKNATIQEGLADFAAAHIIGSPEIGQNLWGENQHLRNISTRTSQTFKDKDIIGTTVDASSTNYHNNSMLVSHIFWNLRETLGAEAMNHVFKPLVDGLNIYRSSYEELLNIEKRPPNGNRQQVAYDLEYVLAVILKSSTNWASKNHVRSAIEANTHNLKFSMDRIEKIASYLRSDQIVKSIKFNPEGLIVENDLVNTFTYSPSGQRKIEQLIIGLGTLGIATDAWLLYGLSCFTF